jgi:hypothetical protein
MIAINDYRQFVAELIAAAAGKCETDTPKIRLAVTEEQLVNFLKDMPGIVVAGNVPDSDIHNNGYYYSDGECLLMVLEKWPTDKQGTDWEYQEFGKIQQLMATIVRLLTGEDFQEFCDKGEIDRARGLSIEWEYNVYGGFNGMSVTFRLKDKNGTRL